MGTWVWESRSASLFGLIRPPTPRMAVNPVRLGGLEGPNGLKMGGFGAADKKLRRQIFIYIRVCPC